MTDNKRKLRIVPDETPDEGNENTQSNIIWVLIVLVCGIFSIPAVLLMIATFVFGGAVALIRAVVKEDMGPLGKGIFLIGVAFFLVTGGGLLYGEYLVAIGTPVPTSVGVIQIPPALTIISTLCWIVTIAVFWKKLAHNSQSVF